TAGASATGVVYLGGNGTLNSNGEHFLIGYNGAGAVAQVTVADSATLNHNGASQPLSIFWGHNNIYGVLNVAGAAVSVDTRLIQFGSTSANTAAGQTGLLNVAGGTLTTKGIGR